MVDIIFPYPFLGAMGDPSKKKPGTAMCVGCGSQIHDQFILRVSPDLEWHAACLKCAECSQYLDETCTCFVRDGKTYCKRDYVRLFGIKCAKCQVGFGSSDLVMRARDSVYHIECFRCSVCSRQLLPGDEFSLREHELLCRADHGLLLERAAAGSPRSPGPLPGARGLHLPDPGPGRQPTLRPHVHKQAEKTTRVRTVLNEKQLHTLRTCYAANPRPDALMKEQLVEMTGLSPRVIRVWFQNKRCKDKKKSILMKQLQQQQHSDKTSLQGLTGTPLVAGSPIRHESAVQGSAVEVQTYQPPWKALSEFALQSDLDQPAFQQLREDREKRSRLPKAPERNLLPPDWRPLLRGLVFFQNQDLGLTRISSARSCPALRVARSPPTSLRPTPARRAGPDLVRAASAPGRPWQGGGGGRLAEGTDAEPRKRMMAGKSGNRTFSEMF
uniref:Insulin gene enhancer protein ISL-2 n=1 Tax=Oryctolagus cuniculus TaxID=9986 RepID=A0A5F9DKL7_RABIT